MSPPDWVLLTSLPDAPSAQALVDALVAYGVAARMASEAPILGERRNCDVLVRATFLHRARWFLAQGEISEAELNFLATGSLASDEGER
jgi:hypothetical protein